MVKDRNHATVQTDTVRPALDPRRLGLQNDPVLRDAEREAIAYLRTPSAIRERSEQLLDRGLDGGLDHFAVHLNRLSEAATKVVSVTREAYPRLDVPSHSRWNHFLAGGTDRLALLDRALARLDRDEQVRCRFDLAIVSVLLDAGAGEDWRYRDPETHEMFQRSEGLAVASFYLFCGGEFSDDESHPLRADAASLESFTEDRLATGFQVTAANRLVGLEGRVALLRGLGKALRASPEIFGAESPRPGGLYDYLQSRAMHGKLPAASILGAVLEGLGPIWPGRVSIAGVNLGDVWPHAALGGSGPAKGLVPFHKLSQWLTYSLIEPLETSGLAVVDVEELTGLPEYRNGGLLIDMGVLEPKHKQVTTVLHAPGSAVIVEWRALTVVLLDRLADAVRESLGADRASLPLAKVLEGGTWRAGRQVAKDRRADGRPPIRIQSDGTVF